MRYGARILFEDVTTSFQPGRRYAITGPNGAGKSTLMKILTGDLEPARRGLAFCVRISSPSMSSA
jgi:ATPase subunit of ABC transporter with duplicated ATPase domains